MLTYFLHCIQVAFELVVNDNLGLMIRGGIEYGLGIYITGVDEESAAFRNGLRVRFFCLVFLYLVCIFFKSMIHSMYQMYSQTEFNVFLKSRI